jgi:hypothetical protein
MSDIANVPKYAVENFTPFLVRTEDLHDSHIPEHYKENMRTFIQHNKKLIERCKDLSCSIVGVQGTKIYYATFITDVMLTAGSCVYITGDHYSPGRGGQVIVEELLQ